MNFAAPFIDYYTQPRTYGHSASGATVMLGQSITRNSLLLALFAVCTTALIAGTFLSTKDKIALQKRMAGEKALLEIVPRSRHDNSMLDDTLIPGPTLTDWAWRKTAKHLSRSRGRPGRRSHHSRRRSRRLQRRDRPDRRRQSRWQHRRRTRTGAPGNAGTGRQGRPEEIRLDTGLRRALAAKSGPGRLGRKERQGGVRPVHRSHHHPGAVVSATLRVLQFVEANRTTLFGEQELDPTGDQS